MPGVRGVGACECGVARRPDALRVLRGAGRAVVERKAGGVSSPPIKYPGSKWRIAAWIVANLPPHTRYLDPFFGSGAVFFSKPPAVHEVINDLDGDVVNLFRVIRGDGERLAGLIEMTPWAREEYEACRRQRTGDAIEDARRFVVECWQGYGSGAGGRGAGWKNGGLNGPEQMVTATWRRVPDRIRAVAERLRNAEIECRPAVEVIARYGSPATLIYADPPYPKSTRNGRLYAQDAMTDADHIALLDALDAHRGPVALSGYHCPLYDDRLAHWRAVETQAQAEKGNTRTEVLWLNRVCVERLGYGPLFEQEAA